MLIRSLTTAFALVVALAGAPPAQRLDEGESSDVWDEVANYKGWPVAELVLAGVEGDTRKQLRGGLRLARNGVLYRPHLLEDIDRIRLFLSRRGYPYSRVEPLIEPDREMREIRLTLEVDKGPPVTVTRYGVANIPESLEERVEASLQRREGEVFADDILKGDVESTIEELRKAGHARAEAKAEIDWLDSTSVAVGILAEPGPVYYFRDVTVEGVPNDLAALAYTLVDIERGERYDPRAEREAKRFLSRTGLFRQIQLSLEDAAADSLDLIVTLQQRQPRSIEAAVGYWSDEQFTGRARWEHRNIFGHGRAMSVEVVYNQFRQWGEWLTRWPALFGMKRSIGTLRIGINSEREDSYELLAPTAGVSYGYSFTHRLLVSLSANLSRASYDVKTDEKEDFQDPAGLVGWVEGRLARDGTNDRISPTQGSFSWLRFQWGPRGGVSEANWMLVEGNASYLFPIKSTVLAVNVRLGWGKPVEPADMLLPDRRFYAGGSVSHRGFRRRRLGPKDTQDLPLGGEVLALGFVEYRFPIFWKFNGAVFADWGQVWQTNDDVTARNIEVAVGPALRIMTPVGPLRLDWGIRLTNYDTSQPRSAFHFAIGYPM